MQQASKLGVGVDATVERGAGIQAGVAYSTRYRIECWDRHGRLKWVEEVDNLVVNEGLDNNLDVALGSVAKPANWYVGLIDNAGFTTIAATDTAAGINTSNGWQTFGNYTQAARPICQFGAASGQSIDNSANKAVFDINALGVINGAFLIDNSTKGGTTGTLYGAASFSTVKNVDNGDTLNVTVTATAAAA